MLLKGILLGTLLASCTCVQIADIEQAERDIYLGIVSVRAEQNLSIPIMTRELDEFAGERAYQLSVEGILSHDGFLKEAPRAGYTLLAEVLARTDASDAGADALEALLESPSHKAVLLDPRAEIIGVGAAADNKGVTYFSVVIAGGVPCESNSSS